MRAQLDHVLIDVDFFDKPKIKALIFKHGQLSALFLIRVYMAMSRATAGRIQRDAAMAIAYEMRMEGEAEAILAYAELEGLIQVEGTIIYSERVDQDQKSLFERRADWKNRKRQQRDNSGTSTGQDDGQLVGQVKDTPWTREESEDLNTEDLNTEDLKDLKNKLPVSGFPVGMDRSEVREALARWILTSRTRHKKNLDIFACDALLMRYSTRPDEFIKDINYSISEGFKTLCVQRTENAKGRDSPRDFQAELVVEKKRKAREWAEKRDAEDRQKSREHA